MAAQNQSFFSKSWNYIKSHPEFFVSTAIGITAIVLTAVEIKIKLDDKNGRKNSN